MPTFEQHLESLSARRIDDFPCGLLNGTSLVKRMGMQHRITTLENEINARESD
jgi:hypothetical protein